MPEGCLVGAPLVLYDGSDKYGYIFKSIWAGNTFHLDPNVCYFLLSFYHHLSTTSPFHFLHDFAEKS